jgi:hypothetical protein
MKTYPGIDYDFRPKGYLDYENLLSAHLGQVKGRERREMIRAYAAAGELEQLDSVLKQVSLSDDERERLGAIHPSLMGGEFLPDYAVGEREIARIELASVGADVISIRARRVAAGYRYTIVDEYETHFELAQKTSRCPFSLGELIAFLDGSQHPDGGSLPLAYNRLNDEYDRDAAFTRVHSELYRQLEKAL